MTMTIRDISNGLSIITLDLKHIPSKEDDIIIDKIWYKVDGIIWNFDNNDYTLYVVPSKTI